MDSSRLLSVLHDDPFDGNFWSTSNENYGLQQLTDTLHGILPIAGADDATEIYEDTIGLTNDLRKGDDSSNCTLVYEDENEIIYNNFAEDHLINDGNGIEIVTINSNSGAYETDDDDDVHAENDGLVMDFIDNRSECSDSTFRTRTDSSSIADYESHTSDYEDDEENIASMTGDTDVFFDSAILARDDFLLDGDLKLPLLDLVGDVCAKRRTISTNTIGSDVDGLGVAIDASTFDLADFITKDDFILNSIKSASSTPTTTPETRVFASAQKSIKIAEKHVPESDSDSNSDSDVIVDVETIEVDSGAARDVDEEVPFVDNIKGDPSWSPRAKPDTIAREKQIANKSVVGVQPTRQFVSKPNKKQCDFLKGKFGGVRGKLQPALRALKVAEKNATEKKETTAANIDKSVAEVQKLPQITSPELPVKETIKRKLNLEEYKMRRSVSSTANCTPIKDLQHQSPLENKLIGPANNTAAVVGVSTPPKKHSEAVVSVVKTLKEQQVSSHAKMATDPITEARNKVLRMQEQKRAQQLKIIDSTLSAKVPRVTKLLPLKDIMRNTAYSAGVARDVPVKHTAPTLHADYEEIISVSTSCNTEISIPPPNVLLNPRLNAVAMQRVNKASRSLLKSSVLLQKLHANDSTMQLTTHSLIASIQNVVVMNAHQKQTMPSASVVIVGEPDEELQQQAPHGEDKIIMHLRKDRMRNSTVTVAVQTDFLPDFPIFPAPTRRKQYRKRHKTQSTSEASSSSDSETDERSVCARQSHSTGVRDSYSSSSERIRHCGNGVVAGVAGPVSGNGGTVDTAGGGYSSRSSRRHRSSISSSYSESERVSRQRRQRRSSYKQRTKKHARRSSVSSSASSQSDYSSRGRGRTRSRSPLYERRRSTSKTHSSNYNNNNNRNFADRNVSQPAVEERRIVYVGRIEQDTTKEMLRRKFSAYGPINQITLHYKDTGMKYGFVTFERSQDAFTAIDTSARDAQINKYDVSFGGRRAFCRASYADLDNAGINTYHSYVFPKAAPPPPKEDDSFEALLRQVKAKLTASKPALTATDAGASDAYNPRPQSIRGVEIASSGHSIDATQT